jgi:predicted alpha/beta-fold hydrolase
MRSARDFHLYFGAKCAQGSRVSRRVAEPMLWALLRALWSRNGLRLGAALWLAHYLLRQGRRARLFMHEDVRKALESRVRCSDESRAQGAESSAAAASSTPAAAAGAAATTPAARLAQLIAETPTLHARYWPFVLNHGLLQTMLADLHPDLLPLPGFVRFLLRVPPHRREEVITPDGGRLFIEVSEAAGLDARSPVVMVFPGNLGDLNAAYMMSMLRALARHGWRSVIYVRRGCGANSLRNARPQNYSGDCDEVLAVEHVLRLYPEAPRVAMGYSLGANVLLRFVGRLRRQGRPAPFAALVSLNNPYNLVGEGYYLKFAAKSVEQFLLGTMKSMIERNRSVIEQEGLDVPRLLRASTYRELVRNYDFPLYKDNVTRRHSLDREVHLDDFLHEGSSMHEMRFIDVPTLCLHSEDDPVCPVGLVPFEEFARNPNLVLALTDYGGHHAYIATSPLSRRWSDRLVLDWLAAALRLAPPPPSPPLRSLGFEPRASPTSPASSSSSAPSPPPPAPIDA